MTHIFNSYEDFLSRPDKEINGVSKEFAKDNPKYEEQNETIQIKKAGYKLQGVLF